MDSSMLCCPLLDSLLQRTTGPNYWDQLTRPCCPHLESGQVGKPTLSVLCPESSVHMNTLFLQAPFPPLDIGT